MGEPWKMKMSLKMKLIFFRIEGENIVDSDQPFKKRSERMVLNLTHGRFALALHKSVWELHICCHGGKELRRFALALHKSVRELHICCHGGKELRRSAVYFTTWVLPSGSSTRYSPVVTLPSLLCLLVKTLPVYASFTPTSKPKGWHFFFSSWW